MVSDVPWLAAFTNEDSGVNDAKAALDRSPNHCTRLIGRFLVLLVNHIIMASWQSGSWKH